MAVTIKCQKCGAENRLGQLFCRECGTKLDLSQLKPGTHHHITLSSTAVIVRIVRLLIAISLIVILGLLCWGVGAPGDAPNPQGSQVVQAKMSALRGAIMRNNDVQDIFLEADINGHLNSMLVRGVQGRGLLKLSLKELNVDLNSSSAKVWMKTSLGPIPLTYSTDVQISRAADGQLIFDAGKVHIGHLSMPGPLRSRIINQFVAVYAGLREEMTLLNRLGEVRVEDGILQVATIKQ
jgi:hypothetical protein